VIALTERMQHRVERELSDADGCLLVINAEQGWVRATVSSPSFCGGARAAGTEIPVTIAANKVDRANQARTAACLQAAAELDLAQEIFPVSARTGAGVPTLVDHLIRAVAPRGRSYFSAAQRSDQAQDRGAGRARPRQILSARVRRSRHAVEVEVIEIRRARRRPWCGSRPSCSPRPSHRRES